jgi:hypothetical protein
MPWCYFCVLESDTIGGPRSDALRRHCKAAHTAADIVDRELPNGYRFRRDTDRPNLLISLKTEGSKENCGYCFDCHTQIPMPRGQCPNKVAYIQQHQCREVKPRAKRTVVSGGAGTATISVPVAPSYKLTEERISEYHKLITPDFKDILPALHTMGIREVDESLNVDIKRSEANIYKALAMTLQGLKEAQAAKSATVSTSGGLSMDWLFSQYAIHCNAAKSASRAKLLRNHYKEHHDTAEADAADDEDTIYIKEEQDKDWLFGLLDVAIGPKKGSKELEEANAMLDQNDITISDLRSELSTARQNAAGHYTAVIRLEDDNRLLRTQLEALLREKAEQTDTITHTV